MIKLKGRQVMDNKENAGNENTGNSNTGYRNTGNSNTGYRNTGDWNAGDWNTGNENAGNCNTGYSNTGNRNTGNWNTGYRNTGYRNTGDWNTGNENAGNRNTGNWNTGDWNTGYCNSITPDECLIFNKKGSRKEWDNTEKPNWIYVNLTEWIPKYDMTEKEKEAYPSYVTTGGYLKCYSSLQHAFIESWEKASKEDKELTFKLPNFDIEVFEEVFGFNPVMDDKVKVEISRELAKALNLIN